jgi:hypothetical protein|tara:strand:+ start:288 stop:590 length:303 start_codon:yes stop_codon:yes gene_type:complete
MNKKRICFEDTPKRHADLKIRLRYDGLSMTTFFSEVVAAYLEKNENIMKFVGEIREYSETKKQAILKTENKERDIINKFGLKEDEIEDIFDIIKRENPEI